MAASPADRSPRAPSSRHCSQSIPASWPRTLARLISLIGALLLIALAGSALLLFGAGGPAAAQAATSCPITGLPPTPTSGSPLDTSTIKLNELLTAPKKDWNCDGKADAGDQWIELKNTSGKDESLFGLQMKDTQGHLFLLNSSYRIAANGFFVIFRSQIQNILLDPGSGQLQLFDASGVVIDAVNYPPLGTDLSYARTSGGQWQTTSTPTPGKANVFTSGKATPKPTATRHSGGGGRGGPTATPTPLGTIFLPTDTPSGGVALQNPGGSTPDSSGASSTQGVPSGVKIALFACIGALLLGVGIWYWRTWSQEPEDDG